MAAESQRIAARLEELRTEIRAERISYGEIAELQSLAAHIEPGDVELLEWAVVPEDGCEASASAVEHEDGDGCAIYDGRCLVRRGGSDTFVSELEQGDVFEEYGSRWVVNEIVRVCPDEYHVDLEPEA